MKLLVLAFVGFATLATPFSVAKQDQFVLSDQDLYLIELGPGQTRWIAEEEKWALRRVWAHYPSLQIWSLVVTYGRC